MQPLFYILIRSWKCFAYLNKCFDSVLSQKYTNYKILFIDDCSGYSQNQRNYIKERLKSHVVVFNKKRMYSLFNAYKMIRKFCKYSNAVVLNLDGDDWLLNNTSLSDLSRVYINNPDIFLTWGECVLWDGKNYSKPSRFVKKYTNVPYPKSVIKNNSYRTYPFLPLHPRTWKVRLFKKIKKQDYLKPDGSWLRYPEDQAMFYPMLEMAKGRFKVITKPLYVYNIKTKHSIVSENLLGTLQDELIIRKKKPYEPIS